MRRKSTDHTPVKSASKLKRSYKKRPDRKDGLRLTQRISDPHKPGEARYVPIFPVVFKDTNLTYGKSYDVLITDYMEVKYGDEPIIRYEHKGLFEDVMFHAEHGEAFYVSDLAKRRGMKRETLAYMIDRLEDAQLVRRVRSLDQHGRPIHLIVRAPYEPYEMQDGIGAMLLQRVKDKVTKKRRDEVGVNNFPDLKWDLNTMLKAIAGEATARQLRQMTVAIEFVEWHQASTGQTYSREEFMERVKAHCEQEKMKYSDKLLITAIAARRINSMEE